MSGGSKTTQTQSTSVDPKLMDLYNTNYEKANAVANTPFQSAPNNVAPFSATQIAGQQGLLDFANSNIGADSMGQAKSALSGILGYSPQMITSPGTLQGRSVSASTVNPNSVEAGQLSTTDLSKYLNPYTNSVVNSSMEDLAMARAQQQVADNQASTAAGAFGGSRQAVRDSLTTNDYLRTVGSTAANLRSGAYTNAQQAALADITNRLNAGEFSANQKLSADTTNAGNRLNADIYSANSGTNADTFNLNNLLDISKTNAGNDLSGAGLRLSAGSQFASLSDQEIQQALQKAGIIEGVGAQQTAMDQANKDSAYQEFLRQIGYPAQQQQQRNQALGMIPMQQTTTGTTGTSQDPTGNIIQGVGTAASVAAMFF